MTRKDLIKKAATILDIDKHNLDEEWVKQPRNVFEFTQALEDAKTQVDELKVEVDLCKEELKTATQGMELAIRKNPEKFKIGRITDKVVEAAAGISETRKAAMRKLRDAQLAMIDAEHEAGVLGAVCKGLENKKKALEDLVVLQGRSYFAEPRSPKEANGRMDEVEKQANRKAGKR